MLTSHTNSPHLSRYVKKKLFHSIGPIPFSSGHHDFWLVSNGDLHPSISLTHDPPPEQHGWNSVYYLIVYTFRGSNSRYRSLSQVLRFFFSDFLDLSYPNSSSFRLLYINTYSVLLSVVTRCKMFVPYSLSFLLVVMVYYFWLFEGNLNR